MPFNPQTSGHSGSQSVYSSQTALETIRESLQERARIPGDQRTEEAIQKASEVLIAKKGSLYDRMDDLLGFFLVQFPSAPRRQDVVFTLTEPAYAPEIMPSSVVPILLLSEVLPKRRLDLMRCRNWTAFVERYGTTVLTA